MKRCLFALVASAVAGLCLHLGTAAAAPVLPDFLAKGLAWQHAQIDSGGSIRNETASIALPIEVRTESAHALAKLGSPVSAVLLQSMGSNVHPVPADC